jgi:3-hydroxybutyryl-CoA dehydrogenase
LSSPLAILGPGTLGLSAAQWAAECGLETRLLGRDQEHALAGLARIHRRWDQALDKGHMSPEARALATSQLTAAAFCPQSLEGVATFLEALPEDPEAKAPGLAAAGSWGHPDVLILSGTSAIPISDLARDAGLTGRLVGFHLFVPVPRMAVVEMAVAPGTSQGWVDLTGALGASLRKRVVQVRDQPGFAAARMALVQGLEAMRLLESGVASAEDLDALMTLGYGHPVGPLELSDRVGLELRLRIAERLSASGESRFQPPPNLREHVQNGRTGAMARRGFYDWDAEGKRT